MTAGSGKTAEAIAALLRERLTHLAARGQLLNEAATLDLVIKPALEALGYPADYRIPEHGEQRNRLDDSCYLRPVTERPGPAAIIVEAKQLGVNFDQGGGPGRADSPNRQIQRYLERHKASGPDTLGVLTDGARWRIYRRVGAPETPGSELVTDLDFRPLTGGNRALSELLPSLQEQLERLVALLSRESISFRTTPSLLAAPTTRLADDLFSAMAGDVFSPSDLLQKLVNDAKVVGQSDLAAAVNLQGKAQDAHSKDWQHYSYTPGLPLKAENPALFEPKAVVAAVQFEHREDAGLARPDVALAARAFAAAEPSKTAVLLAYTVAGDGAREARLAAAANGQVNMTAAFDPTLAAPSARAAADKLLQNLHQPPAGGLTVEQLMLPLEASSLRQQFYREIARWTTYWQAGKGRPQRQAILRHLVRVMFAWILKEENIIPPELFEQAFAGAALPATAAYHREILRFLFHNRLNVPEDKREEHSNPAVNGAMEQVPFLNGSLFAKHEDDEGLDLPADAYWNADSTRPGLFTILSRYHWTMDEHRPGESEQTLDPELLSNLFERLIVPTEEGSAAPLRQPQGTYYTPADVADEMVKDALAAAVRDYAPESVTDAQLLELFGSEDAVFPELPAPQQNRLISRLKELRIFDPAVGSGEFLLSVLTALRRALAKLEPAAANPVADIIRRQLAGQDIHPLAVQITRLRLFIALTAARRKEPSQEPLPNLEARIVCADTLATIANPEWRPDRSGQLTDADAELIAALTGLSENRAQWFDAHTEEAKQSVLDAESRWRDQLKALLQNRAELVSPELTGFAQSSLYHINPTPAKTDARLLFYENPWRGFDVVIGNPPYEALNKSMDKGQVSALKSGKGYQTANVGDLYSLFCETALALANPAGGVVTLITPLSIAFGQQQRTIRNIFESRCKAINLRHYDNIPDTIFNGSPVLKSWKNRQRATIITGVLGKGKPVIQSSGLQSWLTSEREQCLTQRQMTTAPTLSDQVAKRVAIQWLRIPTPEVAELVATIGKQDRTVRDYRHPYPDPKDGEQLQSWLEQQGVAADIRPGIKDWFQTWPYADLKGLRYLGFTAAEQVEAGLLPSLVSLGRITRQQANEIKSWYAARPDLPAGLEGVYLAWPQTAYQFIGVIPAGAVYPRRETWFRVKEQDDLRLLMAVLNGHIGFAWWWVVGDGFHVKPIADHGSLGVPNFCSNNLERFIELGQRLLDAIPECLTEKKNSGTIWQNVNFHQKPGLIEELDRLHLAALGFRGAAQDKLLGHLRIMRSSSSWDYSVSPATGAG